MKIPYGISNFEKMVMENYHFVDKTRYIEQLENSDEPYIFFLRPRRFGKSLFVSMLQHYYAREYKDKFDALFGRYYIGQHPTPRANTYHVLNFDFSGIDTTTPENTFNGFLDNVRTGVKLFINRYPLISREDIGEILSRPAPNMMLRALFTAYNDCKIYLLIDEYDHFANEILAFDFDNFSTFVSRNGFVRKFYEVIKDATKAGTVDRLFVTGVTPITLDSLTSGFNIADNFSLKKAFNEMMGFTEEETGRLLCLSLKNRTDSEIQEITGHIRSWYDGYLFSEDAGQKVYNPDMVLYFLKEYRTAGKYPKELIDTNIASDYSKIQNLFALKEPFRNSEVLEKLIEPGEFKASLTRQFSFERKFTRNDFASLMFYLGLVSIRSALMNRLIFSIPNYVIKELYRAFFLDFIRAQHELEFETANIEDAMLELAQNNRIGPFIGFVETALAALSNRDFTAFDEKYIKALFVGFASLTKLYFIKSEQETEHKYPDVMFLYRPPFFPNFQFIFELKYLKKKDKNRLEQVSAKAESQLKEYLEFEEIRGLKKLRAYILVFVGQEAKVVKEIG